MPLLSPTGQSPGSTATSGPKAPDWQTWRPTPTTCAVCGLVRSTWMITRWSTPSTVVSTLASLTATAQPVAVFVSVSSSTRYSNNSGGACAAKIAVLDSSEIAQTIADPNLAIASPF